MPVLAVETHVPGLELRLGSTVRWPPREYKTRLETYVLTWHEKFRDGPWERKSRVFSDYVFASNFVPGGENCLISDMSLRRLL